MSTPVTLMGLGPMGQAMVHTLLREGHRVTVWNRTPSRAADVVAAGATLAGSPAEALAASKLVILSLTDYQAMYDILGSAAEALAGRTIVNLSSDSPDRTREGATWAAEHGARFLTGGVMTPAPMVGTEAAYVYYSGPAEVLEADRETLAKIGAPRYLGEDPGLAQLMYQANLDVFLTALASLLHATALLESGGIPASRAMPELLQTLVGTPEMLTAGENPGVQIEAGEHPGHDGCDRGPHRRRERGGRRRHRPARSGPGVLHLGPRERPRERQLDPDHRRHAPAGPLTVIPRRYVGGGPGPSRRGS
jgi:3-hydroxyisobutyrate dehydrogenase-like beta-hydroxyacid dehydrogenase